MRGDDITTSAIGVVSANERALGTIATAGHGRHHNTEDSAAVAAAIQKVLDRPRPGEETFAFVLMIDRSLYGAPLEAAKELARQQAEALSPSDMIAVIAFDTSATLYVRPQRAANQMRISHDISRVTSGAGRSNTQRGLQLAFETLETISSSDKHVSLFGTGRGEHAIDMAKAMAAADIRVSAVYLEGVDRSALEKIVEAGNGHVQTFDAWTPTASSKLNMRP
jgi:hypothetical protein